MPSECSFVRSAHFAAFGVSYAWMLTHAYRYLDTGTNRRSFTTYWCTSNAARLTLTILPHMAMVLSLLRLRHARPDHATAVPTLDCGESPFVSLPLLPLALPLAVVLSCFICCLAFVLIPCNMDTTRLPRSRKPPGIHISLV